MGARARNRLYVLAVAAMAAFALSTAPASTAVERGGAPVVAFVDAGSGTDIANDCAQPTDPCATIQHALDVSYFAGTIFVGGGEHYEGPIDLGYHSLIRRDFSHVASIKTSGRVLLGGPSHGTTITAGSGSKIRGFTIRSADRPMLIHGSATISHNRFDSPGNIGEHILIHGSGAIAIRRNTFIDPTPPRHSYDEAGIRVYNQAADSGLELEVRGNRFRGLEHAISVFTADDPRESSADIRHNVIRGTYGPTGHGTGILIHGADVYMAANRLLAPDHHDSTTGVQINGSGFAGLYRTTIRGYQRGVAVSNVTSSRFDSMLVKNGPDGSYGHPVAFVGSRGASGHPRLKIDGATVVGRGALAQVRRMKLVLDSSIVATARLYRAGRPSLGCDIRHSRGPEVRHLTGCSSFSTSASPGFVDARRGDYHLSRSSSMINRGNPDVPRRIRKDIDGQKRSIAAACASHGGVTARRDIGADEFKCPDHPH